MPDLTDLRYRLLGIARHRQPPDHYRLLGLARLELNAEVIDHAAERQLDHLQRHIGGPHRAEVAQISDEVTRARHCLLGSKSHEAYAGQLQGYQSDSDDLDLQAAWRTFSAEFEEAWRTAQTTEPDEQHLWLGIPRHQRPASNDRLLGLDEGERNAEVIRSAAERQIAFVRKFASGERADVANLLLGQLSRARSTLLRTATTEGASSEALHDGVSPEFVSDAEPELLTDSDEPDLPEPEVRAVVPSPAYVPTAPASITTPFPVATSPKRTTNSLLVPITAAVGSFTVLLIVGLVAYRAWRGDSEQVASVPNQPFLPGAPAARPPSQSSRPATSPQANTELGSFIQNHRSADPSQLDPDELERYSAMAQTPAERAAIDYIRQRWLSWRSHLQRVDDARLIGELIRIEGSLRHVESSLRRQSIQEEHTQAVFNAIRTLGKLPSTYPNHTQMASTRLASTKAMAEGLLDQLNAVEPSSPATTPPEDENPLVVTPRPERPAEPPREPPVPETPAAPETPSSRKWTTAAGVSFEAFVEEVDSERVMFRRASDDRKASMAIDQLIESDQSLLRAMYVDRADADQYQSVVALVSKINADPEASIDPLKDSHLQFAESPYGGLWSAVCLSEGHNRHEEASRLLLQVIRRIENQQKFDEKRHRMTLAAARNNLAVCKIKDGEVDAAAIQLAKALEVAPEEFSVAIHNARQLISLAPQSGAWALKSSSKTNVEKALVRFNDAMLGLPAGWFYSLDANVPPATDHGKAGLRYVSQTVPGDPVVKNHWCVTCGGTGSTPCGYGNCVRGVVVVKKRVQVAVNQITGESIYGDKNFKETCPNCRGAGGFDCTRCDQGKIP